jgi:hypothetical protein
MVFWLVTPYSCEKAQRFGGTYHLHHQGRRVKQETTKKQAEGMKKINERQKGTEG